MPSVTTGPTPRLMCTCGMVRLLPIDKCGVPPVGTQSMCVQCSSVWRLVTVGTDTMTGVQSWTWVDFPEETKTRGEA